MQSVNRRGREVLDGGYTQGRNLIARFRRALSILQQHVLLVVVAKCFTTVGMRSQAEKVSAKPDAAPLPAPLFIPSRS